MANLVHNNGHLFLPCAQGKRRSPQQEILKKLHRMGKPKRSNPASCAEKNNESGLQEINTDLKKKKPMTNAERKRKWREKNRDNEKKKDRIRKAEKKASMIEIKKDNLRERNRLSQMKRRVDKR